MESSLPDNENVSLIKMDHLSNKRSYNIYYYIRRGIRTTNENAFFIMKDLQARFTMVFNSFDCPDQDKNIPFNSSFLSCGIGKEDFEKFKKFQQAILTSYFGIPRSNKMIPNENNMLIVRDQHYYIKFYITQIDQATEEDDIILPNIKTPDGVDHKDMTIKEYITLIDQLKQCSVMIIYDIFILYNNKENIIKFYPIPTEIRYSNNLAKSE